MDASTSHGVKTEGLFYRSKNKRINWSTEPPIGSDDTRTMFKGSAMLKGPAAERATSAEESFLLFFSPDIIDRIVILTNSKIKEYADKKTKKEWDMSPTDELEIRALLGILIVSGLSIYERVQELWDSNGFGIELVKATMSNNRFNFLLSCVRYTTEDSTPDISDFMDVFNKNCQQNFEPSSYVTLEEQCIPFRGDVSNLCISSKGHISNEMDRKFGIRLLTVRDSRLNFTHACVLKLADKDLKDLVVKVTARIRSPDRLIISDKRFTSSEILEHFSNEDTFYLGEVKRTAPEIPPELATKDEPQGSVTLYSNNMTLICHPSKNNENVFLLSNLRGVGECLPDVLETYDALSCPKDAVDAMCRSYSCAKRTKRWASATLFRLIDIACINAQIIFTMHDPSENLSRRQFLKKLVSELVKPHLSGRAKLTTLPTPVRQTAAKIANVPFSFNEEEGLPKNGTGKKRRCQVCPRPNDCKSAYCCQGCQRCICRKRAFLFCRDCVNNPMDNSAVADDDDDND